MNRPDPVAQAILTARGLQPGSEGETAPKYQFGQHLLFNGKVADGTDNNTDIEIRAVAYDWRKERYLYCALEPGWANAMANLTVEEDAIREPLAKAGQRIKFRVADKTVLTIVIREVKISGGSAYEYHFDIETAGTNFLCDRELTKMMEKESKDRDVRKAWADEAKASVTEVMDTSA